MIATFCLHKQAPEMHSMQVIVLLTDLNLEVLVQPFFLLPVLGGYCKGILCEWIHVRYSLYFSCCRFSMRAPLLSAYFRASGAGIRPSSRALSNLDWFGLTMTIRRVPLRIVSCVGNRAVRVVVLVILTSAFIYTFQTNFDESQSEQLIDLHGLGWIRERGPHVIIKRMPNVTQTIPLGFFVIITLAIVLDIGMVAHTRWYVYNGTKRSASSVKRIVGLPNTLFVLCFMDDSE
ncbi:hypothetical protein PRIPAC_82827 [Pristionchus pacificus]|uniref:G protein-coupled receptor n=1 Tax=Pristionchus pacificus TaxID=54126 RepID=A0A2A6CLU7_PRIPA|nr:hypothetical protein PRIPAC_82827 [Pristionchus pacificus]|eukprot:PDM79079.1 G protein-coupled receptor [Pristionchus pacificus]